MAIFGIVTRVKTKDGYYPTYIRVSQGNGQVGYIKTQFVVGEKGIKKTYSKTGKEKLEISDPIILLELNKIVSVYVTKLNKVDALKMTIQEIIEYLITDSTDLSFTKFAREYIIRMQVSGRENSAGNYVLATKKLHEFIGKTELSFKDLSVSNISTWIESMQDSSRKRNLYPTCIKTMVNAAFIKHNDEENDIIKIKFNPFNRIKIPKNKASEQKSVNTDIIKQFFALELRCEFQGRPTKEQTAQDVCKMVFCLAGINTADLYDLPCTALVDGVLKYKRKKTRDKRDHEAYTEITIPGILIPLFEQYKGSERLLLFSERYSSADIFADFVSRGCRSICNSSGLEKITPYSFRHSWATIAVNECGASIDDVALSLNHASSHKITSIYIRNDYSRIDRLNEKVLSKVF